MGLARQREVTVRDGVPAIEVREDCRFVDHVLDRHGRVADGVEHQPVHVHLLVRDLDQVVVQDLAPAVRIRQVHRYLSVEAAGAEQCLVQHFHQVGCADREHRRDLRLPLAQSQRPQHPAPTARVLGRRVHLQQQLVQHACVAAEHHSAEPRALTLAGPGRANGVDLVDEQDARPVLSCELAGLAV